MDEFQECYWGTHRTLGSQGHQSCVNFLKAGEAYEKNLHVLQKHMMWEILVMRMMKMGLLSWRGKMLKG